MFELDDLIAHYALPDRTVPHLRVNFIASIDGAATHNGLTAGLNNEVDKQVFDALRMMADVVVVGAGTVRNEGYGALRLSDDAVEWRVANGLPEHPVFGVITSRIELEPDMKLFTDAPVRPMVITHDHLSDHRAEPERKRRLDALRDVADICICGDVAVDPDEMVDQLAARGLPQILCEGGPHVLGSLIEADAVDEMDLTISAVLEGGDSMRISAGHEQISRKMRLVHAIPDGEMLFLRYLRER